MKNALTIWGGGKGIGRQPASAGAAARQADTPCCFFNLFKATQGYSSLFKGFSK